ncbi:hypothetical protein [Clavibacter sp. Sh2088]|uniref:hypothetical protein n=1 Tax=Clavibacter sp. Sh2088 TaxID=3397676 RepID=UPI0039E00DB9
MGPRAVVQLIAGTLGPRALAGLICTRHHSGEGCAQSVSSVLRGGQGLEDLRSCVCGAGFTVVHPDTFASRCSG